MSNVNVSSVRRLFNECRKDNPDLHKIDEYINECRYKNEDMNTLLRVRIWNELIHMTPFHAACIYGHNEIVERLLDSRNNFEYSVDVDVTNSVGEYFPTTLHYACSRNCPLLAVKLLQHPYIEVNKVNKNHSTALHFAFHHECKAQVVVLLKYQDIKLAEKDEDGRIPLHITCIDVMEDTDIIQMLIDHKQKKHRIVQLNAIDDIHQTPLHIACSNINFDAVVEILKHVTVFDINATDIDGQTPLHLASLCKYHNANSTSVSIIKSLLEQPSIMIHMKNSEDKTPIDIIKQHLDNPEMKDFKPYFNEILQLFDDFHVQRRWQIYCYLIKFDMDIAMT